MKMNRSKILLGLAGMALFTAACSDDFINEDPKGVFFEENYYMNEEQNFSALVSVYDVLRKNAGGFENMVTFLNAASDDFYAGGGSPSDGAGIHGFDNFTINELNVPRSYFGDYYRGIARANVLIAKMPAADFDEATKTRFMAEARTLRAFYYFQLVNLFGNIPLITSQVASGDALNIAQNTPEEIYAFIESELLASVNDLPMMIAGDAEQGRLTQGAGKAILGKVFLFQEKWAEAAAQLAEVNGTPGSVSQYGYQLLGNFADLWDFDNKFNSESILEANHTNLSQANWDTYGGSAGEGNMLNQMVGPRGFNRNNESVPSYISGWSFNTVTQELYNALSGDPRFAATIFDAQALVASGDISYAPADQDTGYFLKKYMATTDQTTTVGGVAEVNYQQNSYWIRLADSYLMEAEALMHTGNTTRAQQLLDAVRLRVGLGSVPVTLDAVYQERRLELAGEGQRFFDLVRTNRTSLLVPSGFVVGKNEILPLPFEDISNTLLQQNPLY